MLLRSVFLGLVAIVQATAASSDFNPFSWTAVHSAAHVPKPVRAEDRVGESVFTPDSVVGPHSQECRVPAEQQAQLSGSGVPLILLLLAVLAAFCFGWVSGVRHSLSQQALERAKAEVQAEAEGRAEAEIAVVPVTTATVAQNVPHDSNSQMNGAQPPVPRVDSLSSVGSDGAVVVDALSSGQVRIFSAFLQPVIAVTLCYMLAAVVNLL